jgi:hypothetical protein
MSDFPLTEDELCIAEVDINISNQPMTSISTTTSTIHNSINLRTDFGT